MLEMQAFKQLLDRVGINRFDIGIMVSKFLSLSFDIVQLKNERK
jgi:hypothetical protein